MNAWDWLVRALWPVARWLAPQTWVDTWRRHVGDRGTP